MNLIKRTLASLVGVLLLSSIAYSQSDQGRFSQRIGIHFGQGTQQSFPFHSKSYTYDNRYVKFTYYQTLSKPHRKLQWGIALEPSLYLTDQSENAPLPQGVFTQEREYVRVDHQITEYVLNLGIQLTYPIGKRIDTYFLGGVGPMLIEGDTRRQRKGFAFSDILALGILYSSKNYVVDFRYGLRHISNAGLAQPNRGYNSANFEIGIALPLSSLKRRPKKEKGTPEAPFILTM
jgi:hypothetical protein